MKKMTKAMLMTALILGSVQWGTPVDASELDTFTLDEYVVTAARTETKLVDTPANITVVTAEQIESRHYTDVAEVMKDIPGANVSDKGNGSYEKAIMLNGDERVLVLIDGRRVNFDIGTMNGRSGYDLNQLPDVGVIDRIEVLKGSGGALYGSDAVGGVVNIITKKADRSFGKVSVGFGSNGTQDYNVMYSAKQDKTGVNVSASKYKQDYYKYRDYKTDTTKRWPYDLNMDNEKVSVNITQELTDDSNLSVGYDYSKSDGYGTSQLKYASQRIEKRTDNFYAKYDWTLNEKDQGYLQFYHNELDYYFSGGMQEKTNGLDVQQAITLSDTNKLVVGASWREAKAFNELYYQNEKKIDNVALFVNDVWEFAPSWSLNAGARYDNHSEAGNETTFSAGLNKKFNEHSHAYINWGQVFKAPNTDDLFYYAPGGSYEYNGQTFYYGPTLGRIDLKPETGETWSIGYTTRVSENTSVGFNYFESDLVDAIDWVSGIGAEPTYVRNVNEQKKRGLELTANHKLNNNLDLEASYTYIKVENNDAGAGFERDWNYMPNLYRLGVRYHDEKWNADLFLRYGAGGSTGIHNYKQSYAENDYLTLDLTINYQAAQNLKIFAKGYNLLNEAYCEQAGYDSSMGTYNCPSQSRRFLIGAEYSF